MVFPYGPYRIIYFVGMLCCRTQDGGEGGGGGGVLFGRKSSRLNQVACRLH